MKKTLTALAAVAIVATAAIAAPGQAEARYRHGGAVAAGVVGGLALGAIAAGAYGYPGYYGYGPGYGYAAAPAYYGAYGPGCTIRRERVWDGYGWIIRRVRVCY